MSCLRKSAVSFLAALGIALLYSSILHAQIQGHIYQADGKPLYGANILVAGSMIGTSSDQNGYFIFENLPQSLTTLVVSHIGYKSVKQSVLLNNGPVRITIVLEKDVLALETVVVTGVFNRAVHNASAVAITALHADQLRNRAATGTGDLLAAVPGHIVDSGGGEVGAQIYPRGLSMGATADIGFKYSSLQEDGLPVMSTQFQFAVIDMFHRADATVARLEAIRGGSASVAAANSPGGIYNFISKTGQASFQGLLRSSSSLHANGNPLFRTDANFGGPIANTKWTYNVGGFYRHDEGARDLNFDANKGGQLKANLFRSYGSGFVKLYGKLLDDQVIFYKQLPIATISSQEAYPGFDLQTSSLIVDVAGEIPDAGHPARTRQYDAGKGIRVQNAGGGVEIVQELPAGWELQNNFKYGYFVFDHQQSSGHNLLPVGIGLNPIHQLSSSTFNSYRYEDLATGELLAEYANGQLIGENKLGNYALLTLGKTVTYTVHDVINKLSLSKSLHSHQLTAGFYAGHSDIKNTLNLDFVLGRFEPNPRLLRLTHPNPFAALPGQPPRLGFTDENGYAAYGFGTFTNFSGQSAIGALFLNDVWQPATKLRIDLGLRYEWMQHRGEKERWRVEANRDAQTNFVLGQDGDGSTFYDAFFKQGTGEFFKYDFGYEYLSASLGANFRFSDDLALYGRLTRGVKAPETTYYINNFVNIDFVKGFEEEISQIETGLKWQNRRLAMLLTGFCSKLDNVPFQQLVVSGDIGQFTPATFNSSRTIGVEIESSLKVMQDVQLNLIATVQDPEFVDFNYYNINRTGADFSDDFIESFDGNTINEVPALQFEISPIYSRGRLMTALIWRYMGERWANRRNTVRFPGFHQFDLRIGLQAGAKTLIFLHGRNLANAAGLMNFEGVGIPRTTGEDVTPALIENVVKPQQRPYFARPILPRSISLGVEQRF